MLAAVLAWLILGAKAPERLAKGRGYAGAAEMHALDTARPRGQARYVRLIPCEDGFELRN